MGGLIPSGKGASGSSAASAGSAAAIARSFTPWWAAPEATEADRDAMRHIFGGCGAEAEIGPEAQIDYFTALTGSDPAFPALLAAAMSEHAVARGLEAATRRAREIAPGPG